jgi:hypothetical protein
MYKLWYAPSGFSAPVNMSRGTAPTLSSFVSRPTSIADDLGDFYQDMLAQTKCTFCEANTQRYVGVLSATNRSSCQCKKGLHSSAIPRCPLPCHLPASGCSNVEIERREFSGYYHPEATAGEVSCVLSIATSRLSNLQAPIRPVLSDAVRYNLELAECFAAGMLCVPGRRILWR